MNSNPNSVAVFKDILVNERGWSDRHRFFYFEAVQQALEVSMYDEVNHLVWDESAAAAVGAGSFVLSNINQSFALK